MASTNVLLLDEPSLGLSPLMVREAGRIISRINEQGVTVILIGQNARMALRLAQKAHFLEVGNTILNGNAQDLVNNDAVKKAYLGTA